MIKLIGTNHADVEDNPADIGSLLLGETFDVLFVEGISSDISEQEINENFKELFEKVREELGEFSDEEDIFYGLNNLKQGPEPEYVENEWLDEENRDSVIFLDDKRSSDHVEQSIVSGLRDTDMMFYFLCSVRLLLFRSESMSRD